jgi:hypothetical protein
MWEQGASAPSPLFALIIHAINHIIIDCAWLLTVLYYVCDEQQKTPRIQLD